MPVLFAADSFWLNPDSYFAMLKVAIGLGVVIFVHELGHFLVAKACGVKCEKFYVGFDFFDLRLFGRVILPRALFKFQWGETEYGLGIIPLGGYVKMLGQDDDPRKIAEENERIRQAKQPQADADAKNAPAPANDDPNAIDFAKETADANDGEIELDPRSYQAKPVWQRFCIISAGVIVNLIFAVIFASFAYLLGVKYQPCEIAYTVPGGSAWEMGIPEGSRIIQIGRNGKQSENLRFDYDLRNAVVMAGEGNELEMLVRHPDGTEKWYKVTPRKQYPEMPFGSIGVSQMLKAELPAKNFTIDRFPAADIKSGFQGKDKIVAVETPDGSIAIENYIDLRKVMGRYNDVELTVVVERKAKEKNASPTRHKVTVPPNRLKRLGVQLEYGSISAMSPTSPAKKAGLEIGDKIVSIAGVEIADILAASDDLRQYYDIETDIEVLRDGKKLSMKITPQAPTIFRHPYLTFNSVLSIEPLGVVVPLKRKLAGVVQGSPAAKVLKAGDQITKLEIFHEGEAAKKAQEIFGETEFELTEKNNEFLLLIQSLQGCLKETQVKVTYIRGGKSPTTVTMKPYDSEQFYPDRGFRVEPDSDTHTADSVTEACSLGFRETYEDCFKVVAFLQKLVTFQISPKHLGGPGSIAVAATSEASQGTTRLLIFLTFLSANLAVVNFLPIPVLDGGHAMFLLWEGITGKPVSEKVFVGLSLAGFTFVIGLMLFVISLDVMRFGFGIPM